MPLSFRAYSGVPDANATRPDPTTIERTLTDGGLGGYATAVYNGPVQHPGTTYTDFQWETTVELASTGSSVQTRPEGTTFNVKTGYGAVGNGVADDTTAIQNALNAAATAASVTVAAVVYFPAGTYMISAALNYGSNVVMRGDAAASTTVKNTRGRADTAFTTMLQPTGGAPRSNIIVEKLTFHQEGEFYDTQVGYNRSNALCVSANWTTNMVIQDCGFQDIATIAVWTDSAGSAQPTNQLKILRNHVYRANGDAFSFFGQLFDCIVQDNIIEDTADEAIAFQATSTTAYPSRIRCRANTIRDCIRRAVLVGGEQATPNGINIHGADNVIVENNDIRNVFGSCIRSGFGARKATTVIIRDNFCSGAGTGNSGGIPPYGIWLIGNTSVYGYRHTFGTNPFGNIAAYQQTGFEDTDALGFAPVYPGTPPASPTNTAPTEITGGDGYYQAMQWAIAGPGTLVGRNAYAGMQSNGNINGVIQAKMAIFSVWDATTGTPGTGVTGQTFTGEGSGYSLRFPFQWQIGRTYRWRVFANGVVGTDTRWRCEFTDLTTGVTSLLGDVRVPTSVGGMKDPISFIERFSGAITSCASIGQFEATYRNVRMSRTDGTVGFPTSASITGVALVGCGTTSWTQILDDTGGYRFGVKTTPPTGAFPHTAGSAPTTNAPTFTAQPTAQTAVEGTTFTFTTTVTGTPTPTVTWQYSTTGTGGPWIAIGGITGTTLTESAVTAKSGNYYRAIASNTAGTTASNPAALTVTPLAAANPPGKPRLMWVWLDAATPSTTLVNTWAPRVSVVVLNSALTLTRDAIRAVNPNVKVLAAVSGWGVPGAIDYTTANTNSWLALADVGTTPTGSGQWAINQTTGAFINPDGEKVRLLGANGSVLEYTSTDPYIFNYPIQGGGGARATFTGKRANVQTWGWNFIRVPLVLNASPGGWSQAADKIIALIDEYSPYKIVVCPVPIDHQAEDLAGNDTAWGTTHTSFWNKVLTQRGTNPYLWVNFGGESWTGSSSGGGWRAQANYFYSFVRARSAAAVVMVTAPDQGQNALDVVTTGEWNLFKASKTNVVLDWHTYGAPGDTTWHQNALTTIRNAGIPVMVGEFAWQPNHPGDACCGATWDRQRTVSLQNINDWYATKGISISWWIATGDDNAQAFHSLRTPDGTYLDTTGANSEAGAAFWNVRNLPKVVA